jgi:adenosylmethionine-8-amino-7-oxononanoate aminotransferase
MIMDEVICGFGRLGELFGSTYFGVEPDVITLAKGITSSYAPLGAVMVRKLVADSFLGDGPGFTHGLTFGGHPVSCAAALANLDIFLEEDLAGQAKATGAYLRSELESAFATHPNVGDIRGAGLFLGVELVADKATRASPEDPELLGWLTDQMKARGLILRNDDRNDPTTQLCPPLVITREEVDRVVAILVESLDELGKRLGTIGTVHAQIVSYPNPA